MKRSITERLLKPCKLCPNASFDPETLTSAGGCHLRREKLLSGWLWWRLGERLSLLMSTLGESALLFRWVVF